MSGYALCAQTEGKSKNTVAIVTSSIIFLYDFLSSNGLSTDVTQIGAGEMRAFILYLQQKRCFSGHPYSKAQQRGLSGVVYIDYNPANGFLRLKLKITPSEYQSMMTSNFVSVLAQCSQMFGLQVKTHQSNDGEAGDRE